MKTFLFPPNETTYRTTPLCYRRADIPNMDESTKTRSVTALRFICDDRERWWWFSMIERWWRFYYAIAYCWHYSTFLMPASTTIKWRKAQWDWLRAYWGFDQADLEVVPPMNSRKDLLSWPKFEPIRSKRWLGCPTSSSFVAFSIRSKNPEVGESFPSIKRLATAPMYASK